MSAPTDTPQVYLLVDLSSPFDNPDFVASLANYNPLDPFLLDQGIGFSTPQIFQGSWVLFLFPKYFPNINNLFI
jgi:hypothetical protein